MFLIYLSLKTIKQEKLQNERKYTIANDFELRLIIVNSNTGHIL